MLLAGKLSHVTSHHMYYDSTDLPFFLCTAIPLVKSSSCLLDHGRNLIALTTSEAANG